MHSLGLYLWELAVAICIFGWGLAGLQLLRFNRPPLALAGSFGIALLVALGGFMNLLHLLSPAAMYVLVGAGILLAAYTGFQPRRHGAEPTPAEPWDLPSKIVVGTAILVLGVLLLGSLRPLAWSQDDLRGYTAFAKKTLDNHSVQSDPFSERRIVSGLGGSIFLDTLMLPEGDFRALRFIDESFGLFLYALSLWTIGRMWKVPRWAVGLGLIGIPIATLIQATLPPVYLTSAAYLTIVIVLSDASTAEGVSGRETLAVGILTGALLTTKSSNIVFVLPLWFLTFVLFKLLEPRARVLAQGVVSLLVAVFVALPWAIAQKANEGTYLYPVLGKGFHASAYHLLPTPSGAGSRTVAFVVAAPGLLMMLGCLVAAWMLTRGWAAWRRASVVGFAAAAALAVPAMALSTGGEAVDRYTAPFTMPMVLMLLFLVLQPGRDSKLYPARYVGAWVLAVSSFYIIHFVGHKLGFYKLERILVFEAAGRLSQRRIPDWIMISDPSYFKQEEQRDLQSQAALPVGATAIEVVRSPYGFDYRRNRIYICDQCGMAGPPPGMPIDRGPEELRKYLLSTGVSYVIYDRRREGAHPAWEEFARRPHVDYSAIGLINDEVGAHSRGMWGRVEANVGWHVLDQLCDIINTSPIVYDDGILVVARIGTPQLALTTR